uniref:Uncharacterized protein n=1 Tax=Dendroctonus ponderosae TaxID=77166 RepID=A0AAR5P177_DENPD
MASRRALFLSARRFERLLTSFPRMGSFNSASKIINDDCQDNDVNLPKNISRSELLQYCHERPYGQLMFKRAFKKSNGKRADESDNMGIKLRKLHAVTEVCSDYTTSPHSLRLFQWNILSQGNTELGKLIKSA